MDTLINNQTLKEAVLIFAALYFTLLLVIRASDAVINGKQYNFFLTLLLSALSWGAFYYLIFS